MDASEAGSEHAAAGAIAAPPGGARHRTGPLKSRNYSRSVLRVASDNADPFALTGINVVDGSEASTGAALTAAHGRKRGRPKKGDKCVACSLDSKPCGFKCERWPGHAVAAAAAAADAAAAATMAATQAAAASAAGGVADGASVRRVYRPSSRLEQARHRAAELS
jgi:hypothetical protein